MNFAAQPMTLILTIANSRGVFQSSDCQLTAQGTGRPVSEEAGSKQLQATFPGLNVQLAFTGVAKVSSRRTIDWLLNEIKALPLDSDLQKISRALANRSADEMNKLRPRGVLTLVLSAAAVSRPFQVALISNAQWDENPVSAKEDFNVQVRTIRKPFTLISGYSQSVGSQEQRRLKALASTVNKSPRQILEALADINAQAAKSGGGYISEGCWVSAQFVDGELRRTEMYNIGSHESSVPQIFAGIDMLDWIEKNFRAAPGKKIQLSSLGGVMAGPGGLTPLPPPEGIRAPLYCPGRLPPQP